MKEIHKPQYYSPKNPLKRAAKKALHGCFIFWAKAHEQDMRYLFLLAPMRSGSTLLASILCSHPDICGYGEHHVSYQNRDSLYEMAFRNCLVNRQLPRTVTYFLDKVVTTYNKLDTDLFAYENCRFVFLLRNPNACLASAKRTFPKLSMSCLQTDYCDRLQQLKTYSSQIPNKSNKIFVDYHDITHDPEKTLQGLSSFLKLSIPLSQHYEVTKTTGDFSFGDASAAIKTGVILYKEEKEGGNDKVMEAATVKYNEVRTYLKRNCTVIKEDGSLQSE